MANNRDKLKKAEEFADRIEAKLRDVGSTGNFFCDSQRERWREHAIRAYLGSSSEAEAETLAASASMSHDRSRRR